MLAQEFLPEPDITYVGEIPPGTEIAIDHAAGRLDVTSSDSSGSFVLTVRLVEPLGDTIPPLAPAGVAYVGDSATVSVDGVAQGQVPLDERGAIYRLDIPNPVSNPEPETMLDPPRIQPEIPTPGPTFTPTITPMFTPTPTEGTPEASTPTPTPTPTPGAFDCAGDCDGNGQVSISELIRGVNIALGRAMVDQCFAMDADGNGTVAINELIRAVRNALDGCPEDA